MTYLESKIQEVSDWLEGISLQTGLPKGFEIREALTTKQREDLGERRDAGSVRWAVMNSLDQGNKRSWDYKGIYLWFWRMEGSDPAWPLYVGKTESAQGMRGRHIKDHITYAASGVDLLCDPKASRDRGMLMCFDGDGVSSAPMNRKARAHRELIGMRMVQQFEAMSVILLPMNSEAITFIRQAEGLLIAAAELLHHENNRVNAGELRCVMNSPGKASVLGNSLPELCRSREMASLSRQLDSLMKAG